MRLGVGRLLLAIASVVMRMTGDHASADALAMAFITAATFNLCRSGELRSVVRPAGS